MQDSVRGTDDAVGLVLEALDRLRRETDPNAVIDSAPGELCRSGLFDRMLISRVQGSTWIPKALFEIGENGSVQRGLDGYLEDLSIPLASPLLEAEVVRRRLPALVQNASTEPRVHRPLVDRTMTTEYVVAPVLAGATVIALLHADSAFCRRPLAAIDRDFLRMYADGVGLIYERAILNERISQQRQKVADVCDAAVLSMDVLNAGSVVRSARHVARRTIAVNLDPSSGPRESSRLARLTAREREVLGLLANGATNAQVADQLTVAESTVKSHVKHILHKLAAGNRAGAIACYMREARVDERRPRWR